MTTPRDPQGESPDEGWAFPEVEPPVLEQASDSGAAAWNREQAARRPEPSAPWWELPPDAPPVQAPPSYDAAVPAQPAPAPLAPVAAPSAPSPVSQLDAAPAAASPASTAAADTYADTYADGVPAADPDDDRPTTRDGRRHRAASPGPFSPVRALAGAAVAVAGVLLGIGALLWASDDPSDRSPVVSAVGSPSGATPSDAPSGLASEPAPPAVPSSALPSASPPQSAAPPVAAAKAPLTVLNNSRRTGLADRAAADFRDGGWPIAQVGNFRGRIVATTVYYLPGQLAQARALARQFPGVQRVLPRFAGLPGKGLTVVLTRDYRA